MHARAIEILSVRLLRWWSGSIYQTMLSTTWWQGDVSSIWGQISQFWVQGFIVQVQYKTGLFRLTSIQNQGSLLTKVLNW